VTTGGIEAHALEGCVVEGEYEVLHLGEGLGLMLVMYLVHALQPSHL
jgi:hypothetical protein